MSMLTMRRRGAGTKGSKYLMTAASNPEVFPICVSQGWCSSEGMTYEDAALITSLGSNGRIFQSNTDIRHFEELAYFGITEIQSYAFDGCTNLSSIELPDTVTKLGNYVFRYCNLLSINLPNSLTSIGSGCFQNAAALSRVILPQNITSIGSNCFSACSGIVYMKCLATTPPTLANSTALGQTAYTYNIYVPNASLNDYKTANNWSGYAERIKPLSEFVQP